MSETVLRRDEHSTSITPGELSDLRKAPRPAVYFAMNIGDVLLTLPMLRALGETFSSPLTLICPKFAFDLCFSEVSPQHADISDLLPDEGFPPSHVPPVRNRVDCGTVASKIGTVDVFINSVPWNMPQHTFLRPLRQLLAPKMSIGFPNHIDDYDLLIPRDVGHAADLIFKLARLFDPSLQIENFSQAVRFAPSVTEKTRSIRASVPTGMKVLVVHADTLWTAKQWPITRWVGLLDKFLSRHPDYVVWIVGMGLEELNVGSERERIFPYLGLPLDLAMSMVSSADLFVGIDSCMLHAADLARVPGVGLFGPTWASSWGFRFGPHRHVDLKTMADITVDQVLGALEELDEEHASTTSGIAEVQR